MAVAVVHLRREEVRFLEAQNAPDHRCDHGRRVRALDPGPVPDSVRCPAGVYSSDTDPLVGLELLAALGLGRSFNPNLERAFGSSRDIVTANGDFHVDLSTTPGRSVWSGGESALVISSYHGGYRNNTSDPGFDLLAGAGVRTASGLVPQVHAQELPASDSQAVLGVATRF